LNESFRTSEDLNDSFKTFARAPRTAGWRSGSQAGRLRRNPDSDVRNGSFTASGVLNGSFMTSVVGVDGSFTAPPAQTAAAPLRSQVIVTVVPSSRCTLALWSARLSMSSSPRPRNPFVGTGGCQVP
jgi:hypothetical protein